MERQLIRNIGYLGPTYLVDLLVKEYNIEFDFLRNRRMTVTSIGPSSSREILPPVSNTYPRDTEPEREYTRTVSSTPTVIHVAEARISNDEGRETSSEDERHYFSDDRSLEFRNIEDVDDENVDERSRHYSDSESGDVENENDDETSENYPDTDDMENENVEERSRHFSDSESDDVENENDDDTSENYPDTDDMENENVDERSKHYSVSESDDVKYENEIKELLRLKIRQCGNCKW